MEKLGKILGLTFATIVAQVVLVIATKELEDMTKPSETKK